jgi:hypothetical protein
MTSQGATMKSFSGVLIGDKMLSKKRRLGNEEGDGLLNYFVSCYGCWMCKPLHR